MYRSLTLASVAALALLGTVTATPAEAGSKFRISISSGGYAPPVYQPGYGRGYDHPARYAPVPVPVQAPISRPSYYPQGPGPGYVPAPQPVGNHYHVMFRTCSHEPWREYGSYSCHEVAHEVEVRLLRQGYQARVAHH